jgi:hypothetical protein
VKRPTHSSQNPSRRWRLHHMRRGMYLSLHGRCLFSAHALLPHMALPTHSLPRLYSIPTDCLLTTLCGSAVVVSSSSPLWIIIITVIFEGRVPSKRCGSSCLVTANGLIIQRSFTTHFPFALAEDEFELYQQFTVTYPVHSAQPERCCLTIAQ